MSVILHKDTGEWVMDREYEINIVFLTRTEQVHTHRFIELVYTLQGKGLHRIDDREYPVQAGDLLLINYRSRHTVEPLENLRYADIMLQPGYVSETLRGTEDLLLLLQLQEFSDLSGQVRPENVLLHFDGEERQRLEFLIQWTKREQEANAPAGELIRHCALTMLLSLVFRKMSERPSGRMTVGEVLLSYIRRNAHRGLSVSEIARLCGYSPEHFSRVFRCRTGRSPSEYILQCRIDRAKELLSRTELPVETVLSECGFTNRTAFFRHFTAQVGKTPLQYRKHQN